MNRRCSGKCGDCNKDSLASRLTKKIDLLKQTDDSDQYNELYDEWTPITVKPIWASIEPLRGQEYHAAQQYNGESITRIRIRYRDGVDRSLVVRHINKGVTTFFEIMNIIHTNFDRKELQLMCRELQ